MNAHRQTLSLRPSCRLVQEFWVHFCPFTDVFESRFDKNADVDAFCRIVWAKRTCCSKIIRNLRKMLRELVTLSHSKVLYWAYLHCMCSGCYILSECISLIFGCTLRFVLWKERDPSMTWITEQTQKEIFAALDSRKCRGRRDSWRADINLVFEARGMNCRY